MEDSLRFWQPGDEVSQISKQIRCSKFLASLLWMRGVRPDDAARSAEKWLSPVLEKWMEKIDLGRASTQARDAWVSLAKDASVVVYGDYDVDGISSTTFMMDLALLRVAKARYYIPHRNSQGYGFHPDVVDAIARSGCRCDMLVVVDCGTQNIEAAARAKASGIPVLIFDHHLAREDLADADALVNPHIDGSDMAQKLCAAGVVWCWAWKNELAPREWLLKKLDLVALATIADCVSLDSPVNRAMVSAGIESIRRDPREGLYALMKELELDISCIDSDALAMKVIPCLNAAGRLHLADMAMKIFFPNGDLADHTNRLVMLNKKRRDLSTKIIGDIERHYLEDSRYKHVMFGEDWPPGVLSSVASHICSSRDTPVVLAAPTCGEMIRGTLRVPAGVDAEAILSVMSDKLESWGGHRMAAGFSVRSDRWQTIRDMLEELLSGAHVESEKEDVLNWEPYHLSLDVWKDAQRIGPFGIGNACPRLYCANSGSVRCEPLGRKGDHIKIVIDGCDLLAFGGANLADSCDNAAGWLYRPRVNYWRSAESLQYVVDRSVSSAADGGR